MFQTLTSDCVKELLSESKFIIISCVACSDFVSKAYDEDKYGFMVKVMN